MSSKEKEGHLYFPLKIIEWVGIGLGVACWEIVIIAGSRGQSLLPKDLKYPEINFRLEWQGQIWPGSLSLCKSRKGVTKKELRYWGWKQESSGIRGIEGDWWEWFLWRGIQHNNQCEVSAPRAMKETFFFPSRFKKYYSRHVCSCSNLFS